MTYLGTHLPSSAGFYKMGRAALEMGANTLQCFVRNPRGARAKALKPDDLEKLRVLMEENQFGPIVVHSPYIMNPCSKDEGIRALAARMMSEDLALMEYLPGNYYNFHPGSHTGQGLETGCKQIAEMLDSVVKPDQKTTVLLETMSGKGSEVGGRFEELRRIIDLTACGNRLGVCLDTCHVSDAGYDIAGNLDGVLEEFDKILGLDRLKAVHINDSMNPCGSHKDRHAKIGEGTIGTEAIVRVITHPAMKGLPFLLETPNDEAGHKEEIAMLRREIGEITNG
ncbi:MAG: deoxyribonuclease IV [Oscillospiraceae bacterium]|nr:deoxyribonuclease IV [Oscillospiraceae bacterium]